MNDQTYKSFQSWFRQYVQPYVENGSAITGICKLKLAHTYRVVQETEAIVRHEGFSDSDRLISKTIALLHDIGRFEQARQYGSISDSQTRNHAEMGLEVLQEHALLEALPPEEQNWIETAIINHNRYQVDEGLDETATRFCQVIRDADKLDINKVFINLQNNGDRKILAQAFTGLPDLPNVSPDVLASIGRGEMVRFELVRNRNDYRMMIISWLYDLNYQYTFRQFHERKYAEILSSFIPRSPEISRVLKQIENDMQDRLNGQNHHKG